MNAHVAIDCRYAFPHLSGIGRYALTLAHALSVHPGRPTRLSVIAPHPVPGLDTLIFPDPPTSLAGMWRLRGLLRSEKVDLLHAPDAFAPFFCPCRVVLTIHDLIPLVVPGAGGLKARLAPVWRAWQNAQCRQARAVLTDSMHSRQDLLRVLGVPEGKLRVVHPSIAPPPPHADPGLVRALGLEPTRYLLYVGRRDPYKNVVGCVRVLAALAGEFPGLKLVLAGHPDPRFPEPEAEAARLGVGGRVVTAGQVDEPTLESLYRHAGLTLQLSTYEGFGYPVVESLARGTPVVCSPAASLPEVGGDAALYCDPHDPAAAAAHCRALLTDPALRERLATRGLTVAAAFSPEAQAAATLAAYASALDRP